jgi:AcrR family transcriptional regulator
MTEATEQRILEGARQVFTEQGLEGCTVQDILGQASVSRRTFYQYYRGKEGLLVALYQDLMVQLVDRMSAAVHGTEDPARKVMAGIEAYLDRQVDGGPLLRMLQERAPSDERLAPLREKTLDRIVDLLDEGVVQALGLKLDPLVYRGLLIGGEGLVLHVQRDGDFGADQKERVLSIMGPMFLNTLAAGAMLPQRP